MEHHWSWNEVIKCIFVKVFELKKKKWSSSKKFPYPAIFSMRILKKSSKQINSLGVPLAYFPHILNLNIGLILNPIMWNLKLIFRVSGYRKIRRIILSFILISLFRDHFYVFHGNIGNLIKLYLRWLIL